MTVVQQILDETSDIESPFVRALKVSETVRKRGLGIATHERVLAVMDDQSIQRKDKMKTPESGIHKGVSFEEYCQWDAVNNSSLGPALRSAKHYRHAKENPRAETKALSFGRLAHEGRLEPSLVLDRYAVMPDLTKGILVNKEPAKNPKATSEYKQRVAKWEEQNDGKQIVEQVDFERVKGVLDALWTNTRSRDWFASGGPAELSLVWADSVTGLLCKARLDKQFSAQLIVDLKTTRDAMHFEKSMIDYGYDRQAAFYLDGYRTLTGRPAQFAFAAVESEAPFGVRAAPVSPSVIASGRTKYRRALAVLKAERLNNGRFDADYDQPETFELPRWARQQTVTLYHGGKPIEVSE